MAQQNLEDILASLAAGTYVLPGRAQPARLDRAQEQDQDGASITEAQPPAGDPQQHAGGANSGTYMLVVGAEPAEHAAHKAHDVGSSIAPSDQLIPYPQGLCF